MNVVVTGSNRGIGLEMVRILSERGEKVFAVCRNSSPELDALSVQVLGGIDVADEQAVSTLVGHLDGTHVDVLINNAGILSSEGLGNLQWDGIRRQFEINTLGPLRVTAALTPLMGHGSKVGIVSSRVGSLADNSSGGMYGYRMSKAAVNMAGVSLANDLKSQGIAVFLLHPGYVRTGMTGGGGNTDPDEAAKGLVERIDNLALEETGTFWHAEGYALPW